MPKTFMPLVYFSTSSQMTHRFAEKLDMPMVRIGQSLQDPLLTMTEPFVLICPTYGSERPTHKHGRGCVPRQVIRFLNHSPNRFFLRAVIATGNRAFGEKFGAAGKVISGKCAVPHLYSVEMAGTPDDVEQVRSKLSSLIEHLYPSSVG